MKRLCIFYPPLGRKSGGTEVLLQVAETSQVVGVDTVVGFWEPPDAGLEQELRTRMLPWCLCPHLELGPEDIWLVPDGWVNALSLGVTAKARTFLYCQNWAYLFDGLPEGVRWHDLPVEFVAVSHPVALFMEKVLGIRPAIVRPFIDTTLFYPSAVWKAGTLQAEPLQAAPVRMAYMPRKNRRLVQQVQRIVRERRPDLFSHIEWLSIQNKERSEVAAMLRTCQIFLAAGFPEGCPLPPLEAMASGCIPIGYTGLGGWDYMRQARSAAVLPPFDLRPVPWSGNGYFYPDGDVLGLAQGVESMAAACMDKEQSRELETIIQAGVATARSYDRSQQEEEVRRWMKEIGWLD